MPVLCFDCTVIARDHMQRQSGVPFRTFQIKGFDLRELALAATALLNASAEECGYALYTTAMSPDACTDAAAKRPRVYLEVVRSNPHVSAIVGPMDGPRPPAIISGERCYSLDQLIAHVQIADGEDAEGAYAVIVKHAAIFDGDVCPLPRRRKGESDEDYQQRVAPMVQARRQRTQYEGMRVIHYDVPPELWRARDLDILMALIYRLLPTHEPRWRETGAVTQETFAGPIPGREPAYQYCLQVTRGEYVAHLRVPQFPVAALVDWLRTRKCDIALCHPVVSIEAMARVARAPHVSIRDTKLSSIA